MSEIWKDIKGFEGLYQVSNKLRIKSLAFKTIDGKHINERIMNPARGKYLYSFCRHGYRKMISVRRAAMEAFGTCIEDLPSEEWKKIINYDSEYYVSNMGRVKNVKECVDKKTMEVFHYDYIIKPIKSGHGYLRVGLYKNKKQKWIFVHRLVGEYFVPNPNNYPQIDHIDTNKINNIYTNLRWCTASQNQNNPLTANKRQMQKTQDHIREITEKTKKPICVLKDGKIIDEYSSTVDLQRKSLERYGFNMFNNIILKVLRGQQSDYHGYTFKRGCFGGDI